MTKQHLRIPQFQPTIVERLLELGNRNKRAGVGLILTDLKIILAETFDNLLSKPTSERG